MNSFSYVFDFEKFLHYQNRIKMKKLSSKNTKLVVFQILKIKKNHQKQVKGGSSIGIQDIIIT
jgi:hypothetical protein